jgi:hypothetical protein
MLRAHCPLCGAEVAGEDIPRLRKAVSACCRKQKKTNKREPRISSVALPPLPLTFVFPRSPESQNKTTYAHWRSHHKDKRRWQVCVNPLLAPYRGLWLDTSRWTLTREYAHPAREFDYANLVGGCKPLIDILTEEGLIVDDSPSHFACAYDQRKADVTQTILTLVEGTLSHDSETR